LMVVAAVDGGRRAGAQIRLAPARLGPGQPVELESEAALEVEVEAQALDVVARERHDQGALVAVVDDGSRRRLDRAREIGPEPLALARKLQQPLLARLGLDTGGEHAGGGPCRAAAGRAAVEDRDRAAGLGQPPADAEAAHARAHDGDARAASRVVAGGIDGADGCGGVYDG